MLPHLNSDPVMLQDQTMRFSAPQHLLVAPESSFLDRLNAVDEELNCSSTYTYNQVSAPTCAVQLPARLHQ